MATTDGLKEALFRVEAQFVARYGMTHVGLTNAYVMFREGKLLALENGAWRGIEDLGPASLSLLGERLGDLANAADAVLAEGTVAIDEAQAKVLDFEKKFAERS